MKIAYFGTPQFSADFLEKILTDPELKEIEVALVITRPDQPVGRKQVLTPSAVKLLAEKFSIPINYMNGNNLTNQQFNNIDLALVYAFGKIIPADILQIPKYGFWNIHPSLLPKYRGPSPTTYPLLNGDKVTGVTLMKMDEKMDHGPIISQVEYAIGPDMRRPELETELTNVGFELFKKEILNVILAKAEGPLQGAGIQDHSQATYTKLLKKDDGFVVFQKIEDGIIEDGREIYNKFRALYPWPGIWTLVDDKRMKITDCAFADGKLVIKKVQFEGKNEIPFNPSIINV